MDKKKKSLWDRITKKKKHPVSTSSSSTSLVMPEVSRAPPISSPNRFFERDPPQEDYDYRDLKVDDKINNTQELAYLLQKPDLSPEKIKHLEKIMLKVIQTFLKDELKSSAGVNEVIPLVPVLDKETTRRLVGKLVD